MQNLNTLDTQICCAHILGAAVTRAMLAEAFSRVENKSNWKLPIDIALPLVSDFDLLLVREAVIFFTGSVPEIVVETFRRKRVIYRVRAAGYYAAVGA